MKQNDTIQWKTSGGMWLQGTAITKSGKRAAICEAATKKGRYFTVYIEGDKRNAATRATLEQVYKILNER